MESKTGIYLQELFTIQVGCQNRFASWRHSWWLATLCFVTHTWYQTLVSAWFFDLLLLTLCGSDALLRYWWWFVAAVYSLRLPREVKNPPATVGHRRSRFHPWVGKIPWRRTWQPTPGCLPGKSHGQRSLECFSPRGCKRVGHDCASMHTLPKGKSRS